MPKNNQHSLDLTIENEIHSVRLPTLTNKNFTILMNLIIIFNSEILFLKSLYNALQNLKSIFD
jgi:hypothetical protein